MLVIVITIIAIKGEGKHMASVLVVKGHPLTAEESRTVKACSDPQKLDFFGVEKSTPFFML